jgi:hypothetical protein
LIGRNLKVLAGLFWPIAFLLYLAISTAVSVPLSVAFVLWYPGYVTLDQKLQTGFRYAYCWAGWEPTFHAAFRNLRYYLNTVTVGFAQYLKVIRTRKYPKTVDIHPLNYSLALVMLPLGTVLLYLGLVLIHAVKGVATILRMYVNHFRNAGLWFRGPVLSVGWVLGVPLLPVVWALVFLGALPYAGFHACKAADIVVNKRGNVVPALMHLWERTMNYHRVSTRYILGQDVPFLDLPQSNPVSVPWLLAGILPVLIGLVYAPVMVTVLALLSIVPCVVSLAFCFVCLLACLSLC